ncbi:mycofactocin biosynthesis chaperone MftB [Nocardia sp. BMG51109]|uniref:mycofactocin biosynthesis chaperone MftB n=1 Tax=Nocardia sp. BMG51109 TaxID=1056816 RepID=UPI00046639BA|nr:mycofactocin biosynthesis chaperone MftB [Nocardia sp. BMG51109]
MSTDAFDPAGSYALAPSISLRPEPFGALVYDFTTRRLSFLKTPQLVTVVRELENQPDAAAALAAAGVPDDQHGRYLTALAGLLDAGTIQPRTDEQDPR